MAQPVLLAVDNEPEVLAALERDLTRRFAADYRIVTASTPSLRWPSRIQMIKSH